MKILFLLICVGVVVAPPPPRRPKFPPRRPKFPPRLPKPKLPPLCSFSCKGLPNGDYADPCIPPCSPTYYTCWNGQLEDQRCSFGDVFDDKTEQCVDKEWCPIKPPTREPPCSFSCRGLPNGDYADPCAPPCSRSYYTCWKGQEERQTCSAADAFDESSGACVDALWCGGPRPTPTTPSAPSVVCAGKEDGKYPDPLEPCSRHFYFCSNGREWKQNCAAGTYFDEWSGDCLLDRFIVACGGEETPKPAPTTPAAQIDPFFFDCTEKIDGDYENPDEECDPWYVSCSGGRAIFKECQAGLVFDVESNKCLEPQYVAWCPGGVATEPTKIPSNPTITPFEFDCWGKLDGYYENPWDECSGLYVSCVGQEVFFMTCPGNLKFDVVTTKCLDEMYVEWCPGGKPTEPSPKIPREPVDFDCWDLKDGYYAKDVCSESYYACVGQVADELWCGGDLVYDSDTGLCLHDKFVRECGGTPTESPFVPVKPGLPDAECEKLGQGIYGTEGDCTQWYFICGAGNERVDELCPGDTWFDAPSGQCLFRRQVEACGGVYDPWLAERPKEPEKPFIPPTKKPFIPVKPRVPPKKTRIPIKPRLPSRKPIRQPRRFKLPFV